MLQSLSYTYDSVGNVKSITNKNEQLQMTYDEVDRLISAQKSSTVKPFTATYGYNSIGNMLSGNVNGKAMVFGYTGKPVHAPSSIEMEGVVVAEQKGCKDNNSLCSVNKECVENKCELKKGCEYNNPVCAANEDCIKNKCALKKGCIHKNPDCFSDQECINNKCELKKGCDYNNPGCEPTKKCVNNVCMYMQCPGASCPPQQELADLAVVSFKPVTLDNGKGKAVYELFIKNIGKKTASAVSWEILANSLNSDKVVLASSGSTPIAEFKVGEQKIVYPVFSLPSCKFTIFAYIDSENKIQELDDLNNNVAFTYIDTCGSKTPPPPPVPGDKDKRGNGFGFEIDREYKKDDLNLPERKTEEVVDEERLREWYERRYEIPASDSDPVREVVEESEEIIGLDEERERLEWLRLHRYENVAEEEIR